MNSLLLQVAFLIRSVSCLVIVGNIGNAIIIKYVSDAFQSSIKLFTDDWTKYGDVVEFDLFLL